MSSSRRPWGRRDHRYPWGRRHHMYQRDAKGTPPNTASPPKRTTTPRAMTTRGASKVRKAVNVLRTLDDANRVWNTAKEAEKAWKRSGQPWSDHVQALRHWRGKTRDGTATLE